MEEEEEELMMNDDTDDVRCEDVPKNDARRQWR